MIAHLNTVGNVPESNDSFTTWVSAGTVSSEQSNWRDVGIGFMSQDLGATFFKRHLFWKSRNSCLTHSTKLGQWVTRKKLINHTSGGNADAAVNIVLYGACQKTSEEAYQKILLMAFVYDLLCSWACLSPSTMLSMWWTKWSLSYRKQLSTKRVISCFTALKICLWTVWTVATTSEHDVSLASRLAAAKHQHCTKEHRGTFCCVARAWRSKRACSWSFSWLAMGQLRAVIEAATSVLRTCLSMVQMFLMVWNMCCCGGQVTSRWQRTGRWSDDTQMKRLAQWCKNKACTLCREPSLVYPCWWVGSDTACSVLNVSRMSNTLAVLGLEGESKCMLKSLRIRSLPWRRL